MKTHLRPTTRQLALNSALRRLPFYTQGVGTHLLGTKHSKSYAEYSWPTTLDFWFYYHMYRRIGLAKGVVDLPVNLCWLTNPCIKDRDDEEVELFTEFAERTGYWRASREADKTQRVGHYGGMVMFVADGKRLDEPLEPNSITMDKIVEFMPFWEGQMQVGELENNPMSMRHGLPKTYTYNQRGVFKPNQRDGTDSFVVHHSRILIRNEGAIGRTVYGESALESVYNAVSDWEKKRGAGGEGAWRICAARPILKALKETAGQQPSDEEMDALIEAIGDMHTSFDSVPYLGGMDVTTLNQNLPDLKSYFDADLADIAAGTGISQSGLIGNQTGKLAGEQNGNQDKEMAQSRRENYLSGTIKRDLAHLSDVCSDFDDDGFKVEWDDLNAPSDEEMLALADKMSTINEREWKVSGGRIYEPNEMREISKYEALDELEELPFMEGEEGGGMDDEAAQE